MSSSLFVGPASVMPILRTELRWGEGMNVCVTRWPLAIAGNT